VADDQRPLSFPHALLIGAVFLLAGCASSGFTLPKIPGIEAHRMEIQQGNYVTQEMIAKLQPGMTRDQVRFVLGTPLVADAFHADRWDYMFRRQRANSKEIEQRRIVIFFDDGRLSRIEGDVTPAADSK
jgi:outer membrane protein assembly factor BamE